MGLDMFFEKEIYVGAHYEHLKITGTVKLKNGDKEIPVDIKKISSITEQAGYWRKANAIHAWFVKNVQDEKDECQRAKVSKEDMEKLLAACQEALKNPQSETNPLPPEPGFFFGSQKIDEWYVAGLEYTIDLLTKILAIENDDGEYYYHSSW